MSVERGIRGSRLKGQRLKCTPELRQLKRGTAAANGDSDRG
jgi:hypothetical protein